MSTTEPTAPAESADAARADLDAYQAAIREEIARHGGDLATAAGIIIGAASTCWEHVERAGVFRSERASMLIDVLVEHVTACACNTTEQRTHRRGDEAFCQVDR